MAETETLKLPRNTSENTVHHRCDGEISVTVTTLIYSVPNIVEIGQHYSKMNKEFYGNELLISVRITRKNIIEQWARSVPEFTAYNLKLLTVASLQELHLTTNCDALPSRFITAKQTLQLIEAAPEAAVGTYGGGRSVFAAHSMHKTNQQYLSQLSIWKGWLKEALIDFCTYSHHTDATESILETRNAHSTTEITNWQYGFIKNR